MSEYDDLLARVRGGESPVAAAPAVDDYDNLLKEVRGQNTTVAQANLNIASVGNPATESEKAVLARQLKDKLGEDWAAPAVDPVEAKRRLMVAENDHVLQNSPKLAKQYLDTGFAAQTFDDVPNLGIVEGAVNAVKSLSGAVGASVWGINSAGYGLARAASENLTSTVSTPSLWLAEQQRNAEAARKVSANFGGDLAEMPIMGPVYQGVQSAYQNMLLMPLAFLRNSAAAAVVPMSMITAGQSYGQARDENNASPLKSLGFAAAQGTAEAATEMLPMGKFIKDVAVGAPIWKMMRNQLWKENWTEQVATAWQDFNEWAMLNPDKPFQSYLDARPGAALDTLIATTTATLLQTGAVQGAMRSQIRQNRAAQAEQAGQALEYLNTSIGNTELSKRDRGTLQQFLQSAAEHDDGTEQTVRINALAFENTLMQAGVDVGQVLEQLPTAKEQWAVAKEVGGDLVLPLSEVAAQTFGTDVGNALLPHIAVGDEAMSLAEAQDFQKTQAEEFRKQAEVVMAEKARDDVFVQSAQEVEQAIVQQLATANRFTPDVNRAYSTMMRDFYVTTAARMGITPGELFKQFPLNIVAEGQGTFNQNIEQTNTPEFKNWFGDSKVVDAEGRPLVVYHGSDAFGGFDKFKTSKTGELGPGIYFTDDASRASGYAKKSGDGHVLPVYLKADRILAVSGRTPQKDILNTLYGSDSVFNRRSNNQSYSSYLLTKADIAKAKDLGYDGFAWEVGGETEYVVFDPTQIKSAIGNRGTFDPNDPNILNQNGLQDGSVTLRALANKGDDQAILAQALMDRAGANAKDVANVLESVALLAESDRLGSIPSLTPVLTEMRAAVLDDAKILDAIVGSVPIKVMNDLSLTQEAAKVLLHDEAMNENSSAFNADLVVSLPVDGASSAGLLVREAALAAAKVLRITLDATREAAKQSAAMGAVDGDGFSQGNSPNARAGFDPSTLSIILTSRADLSSFLHESAHFYLKVMGDLASRPDAPAQIRQDFEAALKWFGVQGDPGVDATTVWNAMSLEEQRPYHEKWAESFEAYLFSGKAPSIELQTVFSRFKQWMLRVYQSFKDFAAGHPDAEVNPEVAAIFDRLLATDEQIKLAEQARSMMPLFGTEEKSGMTPGEWAAYQELAQEPTDEAKAELNAKGVRDLTWLRRLHARMVKKYNAEAAALREQEAIEARKEVMTQPIYQAWQFLTGKPLAEPDVAYQEYKEARARYDAERTAELAKQQKNAEDQAWNDSAEGQKKYRKLESMQKARRSFVSAMDDQITALRDKLMAPWDAANPAPADPRPKVEKPKTSDTVDERTDSLFVAIAKLGGINTDQLREKFGLDKKEKSPSPLFGKRVWHSKGKTLDEMRLALEQYGYLMPGDATNPNWNPRELEDKFNEELAGNRQFSMNVDYDVQYAAPGTPDIAGADYGKLNLDDLRAIGLSEELINHLKALRMTAKDGFNPDQVAEQFGFSSGDELARTLAAANTPKEAIEALVDQRMLENHGEFASPQAIATAVDAAIHNEARARLVATELRYLTKVKTPVRVLMTAAKSFADQILGRKKIRDLAAAPFISAASRAAANAQQAMAEGKTEVAAAELRNQLLNTTAANRAIGAKQEIERSLKYLKKFLHGNSRNSIDVDYMDQIDRLLERFDLKPASNKELDKRTALSKWLTEQEDAGMEPDIPEYLVAEANRTHYKNLTLDEFRGLVDTVRQIEHLGRLKNRLLTTRDKRAFDEVVKTLRASIEANNVKDRSADNVERDTWVSRAGGMWKGAMAAHRKIASMVRELDGFKDGGPMWEYFLRSMNDAGDHEATMREQATIKLNEIFQPLLKQGRMGGKGIYIPAIDRSLNRGERLAVALNVGNEGNLQRLMSGYQWSPLQVRAVLATLTKDDLESVQKVWDFFDSYRPQIAAKERRVSGKEPVWIDATPITVKVADGTEVNLRGGYYPIKYDPRQSVKAGQHQDSEDAKAMMRAAYTAATTRRSFTKTRAAEVTGRPLLLSPNVMFTGLTEVIHDLAWHEWLIDANKLIRAVGQDINDIYGAEWVTQFKRGLEDVARGEQAATNTIEKGFNHLRTGATVAGLGWNLTTSLLQPLGLTQSMVRIGPTWVAKGMMTYLSDPVHALENISEKSEFMRVRAKTMMREINEIQNQISGKGKIRTATEATFFVLIQKVQLVADIPTWLGAYEKAMAENTDESRAVALANQAVIDSQGGGQTKDLALVQRGGPVWKLFTNFYSFFNVALNLGVERTRATNFKKPTEVARLAGDYLLLYSVPAVLGAILKDALKGGDDDEDKLISKLIAEQISYLLGLFVGVREVTAMAQKLIGVQQFNTAYAGPAGLRFFQELDKLTTQIGQGEWDDALRKALINTTGILFHYPSGQINRTIDGTAALVEGRTSNPLAPVVGAPKN